MKEGYYDKSLSFLLLGIDLVSISTVFFISFYLRFDLETVISSEYYMFLILSNILWLIISLYNKSYLFSKLRNLRKSFTGLFYNIAIHLLLVSLSFVSLKVQDAFIFPRLFLLYFYSISFLFLFVIRLGYYSVISFYYQNGRFHIIKVVIVGCGDVAMKLYHGFQDEISKGSSYKIMGFFDEDFCKDVPDELEIGKLSQLKRYCLDNKVNEIYFAKPLTDQKLILDLTSFSDKNFIYLRFVPDFEGLQKSKVQISFFNSIPVIEYTQAPLGGFLNQKIKRGFDVVFSSLVILCIYPILFPIVIVLIKLESKGPIFFKQLRPGKANELFECYKFRTMKLNSTTETQAVKKDPRITKVGAFLRRTSLDELPQFINVLEGKMSVVGPRPNLISQLEFYSKEIDKYRFRHFITPGITGWAQVNGFRGETENIELMKRRVEYDAWYIENWSLSLDFQIVLLTIVKLIVGDKRAY